MKKGNTPHVHSKKKKKKKKKKTPVHSEVEIDQSLNGAH